MTSDEPGARPALSRGGAAPGLAPRAQAVVDQRFDASSLSSLRAAARDCAARAGMPADRSTDFIIVLHELAANAVRHGAGAGQLRIWQQPGRLYCRVDDGGTGEAGTAGTAGQNLAERWPREPGHGLWLAGQVADQLTLHSDQAGTQAAVIFRLPRAGSRRDPLRDCRARPGAGGSGETKRGGS